MLRALLHGKLGGFGLYDAVPSPDTDEEADEGESATDTDDGPDTAALVRHEDSLTATIFARLGYLPPECVAEILRRAAQVRAGTEMPSLPEGLGPTFWPRWRAHPIDAGRRYVEPDVLALVGDDAIVIEVKWRGLHDAAQCCREVRAGMALFPRARIWLLMVGTRVRDRAHETGVAKLVTAECEHLGFLQGVITLDWHDLGAVVRSMVASASYPAHVTRTLADLDQALQWRGIRESVELRTLLRSPVQAGSYATLFPAPTVTPFPALAPSRVRPSSYSTLSTSVILGK